MPIRSGWQIGFPSAKSATLGKMKTDDHLTLVAAWVSYKRTLYHRTGVPPSLCRPIKTPPSMQQEIPPFFVVLDISVEPAARKLYLMVNFFTHAKLDCHDHHFQHLRRRWTSDNRTCLQNKTKRNRNLSST